MSTSRSVEGLRQFLQHTESLAPQNSPRRENGFAREFQELKNLSSRLKKDKAYSTTHGEKEVNRSKNRYKDILPYDYTRIILPDIEGVEGSDYINGNYIKGPSSAITYLTAQGPLPKTVDDFWRMIVSHKIQVVVMACREYELGKLKCKRYWPVDRSEKLSFAGMEITLVSQESMGDGFVIRTISAKSGTEEQIVTQFHYTAWPDHDVPRSATPLIELTMSFRSFVGTQHIPVLVHCSAGCGRTGTICALDFAWTLLKNEETENFSVYDIVSGLRRQRIAMVQTKEQYALVYKAVAELVRNDLKKRRHSHHTYVNVTIGEKPKEEQTYENVDFIRSIQRLHQEERNAARKPLPNKETTSPSRGAAQSKALAVIPNKEMIPARPGAARNQDMPSLKENSDSKENLSPQQKPPVSARQKTSFGNIAQGTLPNVSQNFKNDKGPGKPELAVQEYVNVSIGNNPVEKPSKEQCVENYVNIVPSHGKPVPIPAGHAKPATPVKPAAFSKLSTTQVGCTKQTSLPSGPRPSLSDTKLTSRTSKDDPDYEISPRQDRSPGTPDCDYVISPISTCGASTNEKHWHVPEGVLLDLSMPTVQSPVKTPSSTPHNLPVKYENVEVPRSVPDVKQQRPVGLDVQQSQSTLRPIQDDSKHDLSSKIPSSDNMPVLAAGIQQKKTASLIHQVKTSTQGSKTSGHVPNKAGQYSLVGVLASPLISPQDSVKAPFSTHATKIASLPAAFQPFGMGQAVVADGGPEKEGWTSFGEDKFGLDTRPQKTEKPVVAPRRASDTPVIKGKHGVDFHGTKRVENAPSKVALMGSYSLVTLSENENEEKIDKIKEGLPFHDKSTKLHQLEDLHSSVDKKTKSTPNLLSHESMENTKEKLSHGSPDNKSMGTPRALLKQNSVDTDFTGYSLATVPATRRKSEDLLSSNRSHPLYSSAEDEGPVKHKPVALRRSNSGALLSPSTTPSDMLESTYATVGPRLKGKKRTPLSPEIWIPADGPLPLHSPCLKERSMLNSQDSSSSLKSTTSSSSDDTSEDLPPVPQKTVGAFESLCEDDGYDSVQTSSRSPRTLDRFKAKARNIVSGAQISKLSVARRQPSPAHTPCSGSPVEGLTTSEDDLGYGRRVAKPTGPRSHPSHWPVYSS